MKWRNPGPVLSLTQTMDATLASTGLNIIINVAMVREAVRRRIVTLETPAIAH